MMKLFQIIMTASDAAQVNKGNTQLPIYQAYCGALAHGAFPGKHWYTHVADLAVDDLDQAFEVGNIGPESLITRYAPMHSVSVGDVLEHNGAGFIVQSFGFASVEGW